MSLSIYMAVYSLCHEKCICSHKKVSCLQLDLNDEMKTDSKPNELILRDSTCKIVSITEAFPNLEKLTLINSRLITDAATDISEETKQSVSIWYTLYILPFLLLAFCQAPVQNYMNLLDHLNILRVFVLGWIRIIRGLVNALNYMVQAITFLKRALGMTRNNTF